MDIYKLLIVCIILLALSLSQRCHADEADTHFAAHFGTSYAINLIGYGVLQRAFQMDRTTAWIFSAAATLAVGLAYKYSETGPMPAGTLQRAMLQNAAGCAAAGFSIAVFQF